MKTTNVTEKAFVGNPHARLDEGEVASAMPRRGAVRYDGLLVFCMVAVLAVALHAFASDDDWVYDTSARPIETVSEVEASFSGVFDSRWRDWGESVPIGLNMNPRGTMMIFR